MSDKSWLALLNIMLAVSVLDVSGSLAPSQDYIRQAAAYQETAHQVLLESSLHDLNLSLGSQTPFSHQLISLTYL